MSEHPKIHHIKLWLVSCTINTCKGRILQPLRIIKTPLQDRQVKAESNPWCVQGFGMSYSKTERNWLFLVNWVNSTFSRGPFQHCFLALLLFLYSGKSGPSYFYSMFQAYLGTMLWRHSWGRNLTWEHFFEVCEERNK